MPTVIDSLVVTLGLDPKKFTQGQKEAVKSFKDSEEQAARTAKEMEARGAQAAQFFSKLRNEAIALFAVFTAGRGLKDFIAQTTESSAALGYLAHNLGTSVENLSEWQGAVERVGGTASDATSSLQGLVSQFQQIQLTGSSPIIPYLQRLGISLKDLEDPSKTLFKIADQLHSMDPRQATALGTGMGLSPSMINLLQRGAPAVKALLDQQKKVAVSAADAKASQQLQDSWVSFQQTAESVGRAILTTLQPALADLADTAKSLIERLKNDPDFMNALVNGVKDLSEWLKSIDWTKVHEGFGHFADDAKKVTDALGGVTRATELLFGLWLGSKFLRVLDGISKVAGAAGVAGAGLGGILKTLGAAGLIIGMNSTPDIVKKDGPKGGSQWTDTVIGRWVARQLGEAPTEAPSADAGPRLGNSATDGLFNRLRDSFRPSGLASDAPRGIRNNNPGNLEFAGQEGASSDGRFAVFRTMGEGIDALSKQLKRYASRGVDTITSIVNKYAPGGDGNNVAAYIADLVKATGRGANEHLDLNDPRLLTALDRGIIGVENGKRWAGVAEQRGNSQTDISIGELNVHTQATDAQGIARELPKAIKRTFVAQFDYGIA